MSHDGFGERFYSFRQPMWHSLGHVNDKEQTAQETFTLVGPYDIELRRLAYYDAQGDGIIDLPDRALVRTPTPDDPQERVFGIVGRDYRLISPQRMVELWDGAVAANVETLGALSNGRTMFITTALSRTTVKGVDDDEITQYLLLDCPFGGNESLKVRVVSVRTVCMNTLMMARNASTEVYRIIHDSWAEQRLVTWLAGIHARTQTKSSSLVEAFNLLASTKVPNKVDPLLDAIYAVPSKPRQDVPDDLYQKRLGDWEGLVVNVRQSRALVADLFNGAGWGSELETAKGTCWGLYNAVAEYENYRPSRTVKTRAEQVLTGQRGAIMGQAFTVLLDYAQHGA